MAAANPNWFNENMHKSQNVLWEQSSRNKNVSFLPMHDHNDSVVSGGTGGHGAPRHIHPKEEIGHREGNGQRDQIKSFITQDYPGER